jgi:cell division septum initiation protein DivIVA
MIAKEDVLELIDEALARLPEELRAARWLLKEREEYLARVRHEGDEILDQARNRAERMVQRTEVVKAAENRAYQIMDTAEAEARRLRHEVEDFCDQKLASFEIVLDRTVKLVASGRQKLQGQNLLGDAVEEHPLDLPPPPVAADGDGYDGEDEFFDQDDAS